MSAKTKAALDQAITEHFVDISDFEGDLVSGWVLAATIVNANDPDTDGYAVDVSDGSSDLSVLGLLDVCHKQALDAALGGFEPR